MQKVKQTDEYTIFQKRSGRYAVRSRAKGRKWINGDDKAAILAQEDLIKAPAPKAEVTPEETASETTASPEAEGTE